MKFFDHKDLGNHLLQLCPKVLKHPVYGWCIQTFALIPYDLRQSCPDMSCNVYITWQCSAHPVSLPFFLAFLVNHMAYIPLLPFHNIHYPPLPLSDLYKGQLPPHIHPESGNYSRCKSNKHLQHITINTKSRFLLAPHRTHTHPGITYVAIFTKILS